MDPTNVTAAAGTGGEQEKMQQAAARMAAKPSSGGKIGVEQIREAAATLDKYKQGKQNLDTRVKESEKWYRQRHWEVVTQTKKDAVEPSSGWLFNAIANKHADAMDNMPIPNVLPREEGDVEEAKKLGSILPVVLKQAGFEQAYDKIMDDKCISGTGIYGVFWDPDRINGLGDIAIEPANILNLFWEPGVEDIQKSRNFFSVEMMEKEALIERYPELEEKLSGSSFNPESHDTDDNVEKQNKVAVVDWYYKRWMQEGDTAGKLVLHYCKFVGDTVLFASENEPEFEQSGWYEHGMYPYHFDAMYRVKGSPAGFGTIDVGKSAQEYIDRANKAVMKNLLANAAPRLLSKLGAGINEDEYMDMTKEVVHYEGMPDAIIPLQGKPLAGTYVTVLNNKVDELKETTGNRDISTGGSQSGVTAASAIAAMQEAGSKLSRDSIKASYRTFENVCLMVVELIRQFYTMPRCFRIMGDLGAQEFIQYSNQGLMQSQQTVAGVDMGIRKPVFDLEIVPQKQSPYSKLSQNELALQFYSAGFFNPQMADQALACLDMMDFDRKDLVMRKIAQQRDAFNQMQMQMGMMGAAPGAAPVGGQPVEGVAENQEALGGEGALGESSVTKNARQRVAESTSPM